MEPTQQAPVRTKRTKVAIWLMIGPITLMLVLFLLNAAVNALLFSTGGNDVVSTIMSTLVFIGGAIAVITFLPGLIAGIILLATAKQ